MIPACSTRSARPFCARKSATTSATRSGFFLPPSATRDHSRGNAKSFQPRHLVRDVTLARYGENRLAEPVVRQHRYDAPGPRNIELGEGIVEEKQRRPAPLSQGVRLKKPERDRGGALLAGGS